MQGLRNTASRERAWWRQRRLPRYGPGVSSHTTGVALVLTLLRSLDGQHAHVVQGGTTVTWSSVMYLYTPHAGVDPARAMTPAKAMGIAD